MSGMDELPFETLRDSDEPEIYTVSELNAQVRELLETHFPEVWVEGEISNLRKYPSGHLYFTLKDEASEIDAVMFNHLSALLEFAPEDGMNVLAGGTLTIYERRGKYQIAVRKLKPAGLGKLQLAFERLKERLHQEGLFDEARKRPIPRFPERIGIITSAEGAALRDMLSILARRYPVIDVLLFPVRVQGEGAAEEIAQAIEGANRYHEQQPIDVLIVGRGGGSLEDLWAFNEERVARAIFGSEIPVVSAVGHEIDFTIADFVADLRAPTPSAAAELVVPQREKIEGDLAGSFRRLLQLERAHLEGRRYALQRLISSYALRHPLRQVREHRQTLDHLSGLLVRAFRNRRNAARDRLEGLMGRLEAVSPAAVLRRGYSIVEDERGRAIRSARDVRPHDRVNIRLHRGKLHCEVLEIEP